jgi:hypothetical protein
MREIKLNRGYVALVDDEDFDRLSKFNWRVSIHKRKKMVYAVAVVKLHRLALDVSDPAVLVDHQNHRGLDCQKLNLRTCNATQNQANRRKNRTSRSKFKGVQWHKHSKKWMSRINRGGKARVSYWNSEVRAAVEYDVVSRVLDREFACTNFQLCPLTVQGESYRYVRPDNI